MNTYLNIIWVSLLTAILLVTVVYSSQVFARGVDDDNGRGCSPCVAPNEPTENPDTYEDQDLDDGRGDFTEETIPSEGDLDYGRDM